jgi:hypothetical protein
MMPMALPLDPYENLADAFQRLVIALRLNNVEPMRVTVTLPDKQWWEWYSLLAAKQGFEPWPEVDAFRYCEIEIKSAEREAGLYPGHFLDPAGRRCEG